MDIDSPRLTQFYAANLSALGDRRAENKVDQTDLVAEIVRNEAGALELGHDAERSARGAKALLLDVLT